MTPGMSRKLAKARLLLGSDEDVAGSHGKEPPVTRLDCLDETPIPSIAARAGVPPYRIRVIHFTALATAVALAALAVASGRLYLIFLTALPTRLFHFTLRRKIQKRAEAFEADYPAFLLSLSTAVRTGQDPLAALGTVHELFSRTSELYKETRKTKLQLERGMSEEEVVARFAATISHPDIGLFKSAFILSRKHGSSLSPCLQRLVKVTRQRQSFRRKIATAVAMQKLSAIGIACCAIAIGCIQALGNPGGFLQAFHHPIGFKALGAGITLMAAGLLWMFHIAQRRI